MGPQGVAGMMQHQAHTANANGAMGGVPVAVGGGGVMGMAAGGHMGLGGGGSGGGGGGGGRELLGQGMGVVGQHGGGGGGGGVGVAIMGGVTLAPVKRRISREGGWPGECVLVGWLCFLFD